MISHRFALVTIFVIALFSTRARAEWVWVEGEKPVKQAMHPHAWYDDVKKDQFSGHAFISNFSENDPGEAAYEFTAKTAAAFEFWVRANPVKSALAYRLNGGAWTEIATDKNVRDIVNVAADGKPDLRFLGWIDVGAVNLRAGKNTIAFRMHSPNTNHGYLDCFVFTTERFRPSGALKPDALAKAAQELAAGAGAARGWLPFDPDRDHFTTDAGFDLRSLNEKFAGEGGFIAAKEGQFVHSTTGQPIRFWGVNGVGGATTRVELERTARMLAKHGVNLVRLHGPMFDDNENIDPKKIQLAIATVEELKAQGIYTHFSIYFPLWLTPKPNDPVLKGYDGKTHPFAAVIFNPDFQKEYQSWWKALLTTPSDKTGKRLMDDPAVASVEIQNEDSYFFWTFSDKSIPQPQMQMLESQFADWLKLRHGSLEKTLAAWNNQRIPGDDPQQNRMAFRPLWNMAHDRTPRDQDTAAFLVDSQTRFYKSTVDFLRQLGFKGMITASNWTTADARILGPLERLTYLPGDFIDRHGYVGDDHHGDSAGWSIRVGHTFADRSALRFDPEEPGKPRNYNQPVEDVTYDRLPSMISETTFERPNRYRSEDPIFYAAYGALQGSDAIIHFALDTGEWHVKAGYFVQPWTLMSPDLMGQFPGAALLFRKALISPGDLMIDLNLNTSDLLQLKGSPLAPEANFDELRASDVPSGKAVAATGVIDPLIHFVGRTNINFVHAPQPSVFKDATKFIDRKDRKVTSSTGQLTLDYGRGFLLINAPQAQGASGDLKSAGTITLKDVTLTCDLDLANILLVSLDGQPLKTSARMLLQVMSEEKPNGFATQPAPNHTEKITALGHDPWLMKALSGTVELTRPDAANLKVTRLDANGYPVPNAPALNGANFKLAPGTVYYLIGK